MFKDDDDSTEAAMGAVRYPVMPSLVALQQMRNRLHLAQLGKKLMKWTALATLKELRRLAVEVTQLIKDYDVKVRSAFICLARARYFVPQMNDVVLESLPMRACVTVRETSRSISGVKVKNFHLINAGCDSYAFLGMSQGGIQIKKCKEMWLQLITQMVLICQYRVTFELIDAANKNATKKQNVLQRCIIPRISITMVYVLSELDEMEREETFRLKRFKQLKHKNKAPPKKKPEVEEIPVFELDDEPILEDIESEPEIVDEFNPLDLLMMHINKAIYLAGLLEKEEMPPGKAYGLTKCDLVGLRMQLKEVVKLNEAPIKNRTCNVCDGLEKAVSKCSCPNQDIPEPDTCFGETPSTKTPPDEVCPHGVPLEEKPSSKRTVIPTIAMPPAVIPCGDTTTKVIFSADDVDEELITNYETPAPDNSSERRSVCVTKSALSSSRQSRLDEFESYVDKVVDLTHNYHGEGLLCDPEDFVKACKDVKDKIKQIKDSKKVKLKIDRLKEQVINLETMTDIVQREGLSSTSISSFLNCCKEFKNKLDHRNICKSPTPLNSVEKLVIQINESILLSKEAKKKGLVSSDSVDEFIENCKEIKNRILTGSEKPQVIGKLLYNINDILNYLSQYKEDGSISDSIDNFYNSCLMTKSKLSSNKKRTERETRKDRHRRPDNRVVPSCGLVPTYNKPPRSHPPRSHPPRSHSPRSHSPREIRIRKCGSSRGKTPSTTPSATSEDRPRITLDPNEKKFCYTLETDKKPSNFGFRTKSPSPSVTKTVKCSKSANSANSFFAEQPSVTSQPSLPTVLPISRTTCTQCTEAKTTPEKSKSVESVSNSCTVVIKSPSVTKTKGSVRIKMDPKAYYEQTVSTVIKRLQEEDGSVIENSETVIVRQRILDSQQRPVTSQKSYRCTKQLSGAPTTEGFIQTVRNIKSACDFSLPFIPVVWSCMSLDTGQQKYNDPFFCGSPTVSESSNF